MIDSSYYIFSLLLGAAISAFSIGIYFYIPEKSDKRLATNLLLFNAVTTVWSVMYALLISTHYFEVAYFANITLHIAASFTPFFFLSFVFALTRHDGVSNAIKYAGLATSTILSLLMFSEFMLKAPTSKYIFVYAPDAGPLYIVFFLYFASLFTWGIYRLTVVLQSTTDTAEWYKYLYILLSTLAGIIGGGSVFFLTFNIPIPPYPIILFTLYPIIYNYSVLRHGLFNVKIASTEIVSFILWIVVFSRVLYAQTTRDRLIESFFFIITILLTVLIIRSVRNEIKSRETIEVLARNLEQVNTKLEQLNAQKSEFLSIATHQLRTPLGAMNGYTSLILGGSFGAVSDKIKEVLSKVLQSGMLMNGTIEDFLSVSRIDQGRMVYDMIDFPIQKLTKEVFDELKAGAERKGLTLQYEVPETVFSVHADYGKLKHVISNLVDNSIKYTRDGWVRISAEVVGGYVRVSVSDSGVGIPADELPKLFDKFVRARGASGVNVSGTGLGLYVAKQMIEAHKGRVWAESAGEGKGSTFIAELPLATHT